MSGPFARIAAQVLIMGAGVVTRAFAAAYQQALHNAKNGKTVEQAAAAVSRIGKMPRDQARQILNIENELTPGNIEKQYTRYLAANDPKKGGSFYLQSKIYRAKEALDLELREAKKEKKEETNKQE